MRQRRQQPRRKELHLSGSLGLLGLEAVVGQSVDEEHDHGEEAAELQHVLPRRQVEGEAQHLPEELKCQI